MDACTPEMAATPPRWLEVLGRAGTLLRDQGPRVVVGLVLLLAGFLKALAPVYFAQQLALYDIGLSKPAIVVLAYVVIVAECVVGTMLLLQVRPRVALGIASLMVVAFLAATGWAWWSNLVATCGCFGPVKLSPKKAFTVDLLLLAFLLRTWWVPAARAHAARWQVAVVVLVALLAMGLPLTRGQSSASFLAALNPGRPGLDQALVWDLPVDLSRGSHLVYVMNATCRDCRRLAPKMDELGRVAGMPGVVGLAAQDPAERHAFAAETGVGFPIGQVADNAIFSLLEGHQYPSILLLRDGQVLKAWSMRVPSVEEVLAAAAAR